MGNRTPRPDPQVIQTKSVETTFTFDGRAVEGREFVRLTSIATLIVDRASYQADREHLTVHLRRELAVVESGGEVTIEVDDPQPVFMIKAQDALAVPALDAYRLECKDHGLIDQAREVEKAISEMRQWQRDNIERTKLPDHQHVPTSREV